MKMEDNFCINRWGRTENTEQGNEENEEDKK